MIPDFPIDIRIRLAELNFFCCFLTLLIFCPVGLLSFAKTANRAENSANLILMSIGKSGVIKFEFQTL